MDYKIHLQTGFYKKTAYNIKIEKHKIILTSLLNDDNDSIQILDKDITAVVVGDIESPEIQIQTYSKNYIGNLDKDTEIIYLLDTMKKNLRTDFICKGGR